MDHHARVVGWLSQPTKMRRPAVRLNSGVHVFLGTSQGPGNREHNSLNGRQPVARDTNDDDATMKDEDLVSQISPFAELPTEVWLIILAWSGLKTSAVAATCSSTFRDLHLTVASTPALLARALLVDHGPTGAAAHLYGSISGHQPQTRHSVRTDEGIAGAIQELLLLSDGPASAAFAAAVVSTACDNSALPPPDFLALASPWSASANRAAPAPPSSALRTPLPSLSALTSNTPFRAPHLGPPRNTALSAGLVTPTPTIHTANASTPVPSPMCCTPVQEDSCVMSRVLTPHAGHLLRAAAAAGHVRVAATAMGLGARMLDGALVGASGAGRHRVVMMLLASGADPNASEAFGPSALFEAARNGHTKIVAELLDAGACIDGPPDERGGGSYYQSPAPSRLGMPANSPARPLNTALNGLPMGQSLGGVAAAWGRLAPGRFAGSSGGGKTGGKDWSGTESDSESSAAEDGAAEPMLGAHQEEEAKAIQPSAREKKRQEAKVLMPAAPLLLPSLPALKPLPAAPVPLPALPALKPLPAAPVPLLSLPSLKPLPAAPMLAAAPSAARPVPAAVPIPLSLLMAAQSASAAGGVRVSAATSGDGDCGLGDLGGGGEDSAMHGTTGLGDHTEPMTPRTSSPVRREPSAGGVKQGGGSETPATKDICTDGNANVNGARRYNFQQQSSRLAPGLCTANSRCEAGSNAGGPPQLRRRPTTRLPSAPLPMLPSLNTPLPSLMLPPPPLLLWTAQPRRTTPLLAACKGGHGRTVALLLRRGARPDTGRGAELLVAGSGRVVDELLAAEPSLSVHLGPALVTAAGGNRVAVVAALLRHGADPAHGNGVALTEAAYQGHATVVQLLLHTGAARLRECNALTSSVTLAQRWGRTDVLTLLKAAF